jgi:uncharacterized protein YjiS (DUF1127 family)
MERVIRNVSSPRGASDRRLSIPLPSAAFWIRLVDFFALWSERRQQRMTLAAMSDHMLSDIGLNRCHVETEVSKPFWR